MGSPHICHVTTAHPWDDVRIFQRMCCGLAESGLRVTLVAPREKEALVQGVRVLPTGLRGKAARLCGGPLLLRRLRRVGADIYHFHDPELLPWMFLFQRWMPSAAVVYDVHEYYPERILDSNFFGWSILNRCMSRIVRYAEPLLAGQLRGVIGVTDPIASRFQRGRARVAVIRNLVKLRALPARSAPPEPPGERTLVLGGALDRTRGMDELLEAIALLKERGLEVHLLHLGVPSDPEYAARLRSLADDRGIGGQVQIRERVCWERFQQYLSASRIGIVLLAPCTNHLMSLPVRLGEFMANRLPIIASNYPQIANVVREAGCGILLESCEPHALADAMEYLLTHPEEAARMGENGRRAVEERYCWERESGALLEFYHAVTKCAGSPGL
jgi:glycosyltransferase involved in cell wall biosynthesis